MKKRFSLFILLVFLIYGCAPQVTITPEAQFKIKGEKIVSIEVTSLIPDSQKETEQIKKSLIEKLKSSNVFKDVVENNQKAEVLIKVEIKELNKVSPWDRFWYGAMAGRAKVVGKLTIFEGFSGKIMGSFYVESLSSGGTVFAGTTEDSLNKFVEEVVKTILENLVT